MFRNINFILKYLIINVKITTIYKESSRNTDNAWAERTFINYHDEADKFISLDIPLKVFNFTFF